MSLKRETRLDIQLHRAAIKGDRDSIVRVLGTGRVHVDCKDTDGTTPLHFAVSECNYECAEELLEQGADPNAKRYETDATPLFLAAQNGDLDMIRLLLSYKAQVNTPNSDGGTALFVACQGGHLACVQELVGAGASTSYSIKDKATPLFVAAQNGNYGVVSFLLGHGVAVDSKRNDGATPLWICAQMGWIDICSLLLKYGANVNSLRNDGASPLFKASHKGFTEIVRMLLKHRPQLGLLPNGESCLHGAAMFGHDTAVKLLIMAGSDLNLKNHEGLTARQVALQNQFPEVASLLEIS